MPERLSGIQAESEWHEETDSVEEEVSTQDSAKAYCGQRDSHMDWFDPLGVKRRPSMLGIENAPLELFEGLASSLEEEEPPMSCSQSFKLALAAGFVMACERIQWGSPFSSVKMRLEHSPRDPKSLYRDRYQSPLDKLDLLVTDIARDNSPRTRCINDPHFLPFFPLLLLLLSLVSSHG